MTFWKHYERLCFIPVLPENSGPERRQFSEGQERAVTAEQKDGTVRPLSLTVP